MAKVTRTLSSCPSGKVVSVVSNCRRSSRRNGRVRKMHNLKMIYGGAVDQGPAEVINRCQQLSNEVRGRALLTINTSKDLGNNPG